MSGSVRVEPFGDAAVLVPVDGGTLTRRASRAAAIAAALTSRLAHGDPWLVPVPGIGGVLVPFDPLALEVDVAREAVGAALGVEPATVAGPRGRTIEIPVRYGGDAGPDLAVVAAAVGRTPADVIRMHAEATYDVLVLGFLPGFAYLGPLAPPLDGMPRRATARTRVAAGSVALAGGMTAVYTVDSPGGWHVIGRTGAVLWDATASRPNRLTPGDRVRFVPADGTA